MRNTWCICTLLMTGLLMSGCGGSGTSAKEEEAGPCYVIYDEPVMHLDAAFGIQSGAVIGELEITALTINDRELSDEEVRALAASGGNTSSADGVLYCTLPCMFGVEEGSWIFIADADGYHPTEQRLEASYGSFRGDCPATYGEGSHFELQLKEEGL